MIASIVNTGMRKYSHRITLKEERLNCVYCGKGKSVICNKCIEKGQKILKRKGSKIVDKLALRPAIPNEEAKSKYGNSVFTALTSQKLLPYRYNVCICGKQDCDCDYQKHVLDICQFNSSNEMIIKMNPVPPIAVGYKEDLGGYFVYALAPIGVSTYISEYVGNICNFDDEMENNSRMTLINTGITFENKMVIPKYGGNISKFISGHYDESKCNLAIASGYTSDNKVHLVLYAKRAIENFEILYWNYGEEYPMKFFKYEKYYYHIK